MSKCKECVSEKVCRYNDGINLYCKEDYECPRFKNKADVAEVVRCEDCKHANDDGTICRYGVGRAVKPEHFCSYGERKEE